MKSNKPQEFYCKVISLENKYAKNGKPLLQIIASETLPSGEINKVQFEVFNHVMDKFNDISEKDIIKISYNLKGNEWNGKIFTNAHVTDVEIIDKYKANLFDDLDLPDNEDLFNDLSY